MGHGLEKIGLVVETDAIFVALTADGGHVVDRYVSAERRVGVPELVRKPIVETVLGSLRSTPYGLTLGFLLAKYLGEYELIIKRIATLLFDFFNGMMVYCSYVDGGTDYITSVKVSRTVREGSTVCVCVRAVYIFR